MGQLHQSVVNCLLGKADTAVAIGGDACTAESAATDVADGVD
jgi:hypothetical protein